MAVFKDRVDAAEKLLPKLRKYTGSSDTLIVGLPRGGMITAAYLAEWLGLPLDFIIAKKIGAPGNSELAVGAVTEDGIKYLDKEIIDSIGVDPCYVRLELRKKQLEAFEKSKLYRGGKKPPSYKDKNIILVDDGMATGSTMLAAVGAARARGAKAVIVAVPVASWEAALKIKKIADGFVCPEVDRYLESVGEFYEDFPQIEDDRVLALLNKHG